ncbi:hypothetical protein UFOVP367_60 [uncultured Caudovirales phage]|uniref:Uncharacterized protein n=1 Tax=uncultured Caudovirales phage TaxID=2100421 RepID=A0A6J7X722_9CAUD|nr:hypothetical protein UFOVP367_60 [uncultured Caudovirales phage]
MATLNQVLAISESVGINDHRFIGQTLSRNQRISTSEIITVQPFMFDMKPMNYLLYSQNRTLLSTLRAADRQFEQYLNFGSTGWWNYIAYQGDMSSAEISACEYQTSSANKIIVLGSLPTMGSTEYIVKTGDFLQIDRYAYIATADVQRGVGSTVNIPVHRTIMTTLTSPMDAVIGQYGITQSLGGLTYVGITFPVILQEYPTYTFIPMTNDSFITWNGSFKAIEAVL